MISQSTLDAFPNSEKVNQDVNPVVSRVINQNQAVQVLVLVLKGINVAWTDRDWYLHEQDLVYLNEDLATILVRRGIARIVNLSQSRHPSILTERGCHDPSKEAKQNV